MDRVEAPQQRHLMEAAMNPVLRQVRHQHDLEELKDERLVADRPLQGERLPEAGECRRWQQRHEGESLYREMAHHEIHAVGRPAGAKRRLLATMRERALERHEHQRKEQHVEEEPRDRS